MPRRRAKNLDDEAIKSIAEMLDGWDGVLSWQALIEQIQARLQSKYTRQALHRHERIRLAFERTKERLATPGKESRAPNDLVRVPAARISRLEAENDRLQQENDRLLEQFVRWAYNAHTRGLDEAFLNRPLPPVDRRPSRRAASGGKP
jgi:hypothetical protein